MDNLVDDVEALMRHVAQLEIMSRFQKLERHDIQSKQRPGDLVTTADLEAENRLTEGLMKLLPSSTVIGEEEAFRNPQILERLNGEQLVWTVDPLDGTNNFAKGKPCFAMICALIKNGQTQMGWILDPISGVCATAKLGEGVYVAGQRVTIKQPDGVPSMTGSLGDGLRKRINARKDNGEAEMPHQLVRYHCCGREYVDLLIGKINFALYGGRLMPWDHAAGTLMVNEAGGYGRIVEDQSTYDPAKHGNGEQLMLAPNKASFERLQQMLFTTIDMP
ncbi:MAG: inositol monophosphatase family protein [Magnetovibrio sp.]|nr:inositol monophosphatase family protein [Magnetovibrio sp.]